jgi:hypothetical protein
MRTALCTGGVWKTVTCNRIVTFIAVVPPLGKPRRDVPVAYSRGCAQKISIHRPVHPQHVFPVTTILRWEGTTRSCARLENALRK